MLAHAVGFLVLPLDVSHTKLQVKVVSPPEVSLGIHQLPADTHNGDTISIKDQDFIVSSLTMRWRLEGGKYKRYHHRLDVVGVFRLCSVHDPSGREAGLAQPA